MNKPARIFVVDDHPLVREGLAARISAQPDMGVCGEAADVETALARLATADADLLTVDLALKGGHGLDLIKKVRARAPQIKMLVITAYEEALFGERTLRAGAQGFINKQELQEKMIEAIRLVLAGQRYISAALTSRLIDKAIGNDAGGVSSLSDRELQIFQLIGAGNSTKVIAAQLGLSVHTIETHRENIRAKLNLKDGTQLMQRAVQWVLENG